MSYFWYAQFPSGLGSRGWSALHSRASSYSQSANAPLNRLESHHMQSQVTEWCIEECHLPQFIDSTGQALRQTLSLPIYLQPELRIKPRARKDVFFIKTKTICIVLLEPKCQHNFLENMSFYVLPMSHSPKDHLDFSLCSAWHTGWASTQIIGVWMQICRIVNRLLLSSLPHLLFLISHWLLTSIYSACFSYETPFLYYNATRTP